MHTPAREPLPPADAVMRAYPMGSHPKLPRTRQTVAIHEAGHAVVAMALKQPAHAARIDGTGPETVGGFAASPRCDLSTIASPDIHQPIPADALAALVHLNATAHGITERQAALDLATIAAAGRQAEILAAGLPWPGLLWSQDRDGHDARGYLAALFGAGHIGLGYVQRRARSLLTHHWPTVQQITRELIEHGTWYNHPNE